MFKKWFRRNEIKVWGVIFRNSNMEIHSTKILAKSREDVLKEMKRIFKFAEVIEFTEMKG